MAIEGVVKLGSGLYRWIGEVFLYRIGGGVKKRKKWQSPLYEFLVQASTVEEPLVQAYPIEEVSEAKKKWQSP